MAMHPLSVTMTFLTFSFFFLAKKTQESHTSSLCQSQSLISLNALNLAGELESLTNAVKRVPEVRLTYKFKHLITGKIQSLRL